MTLRGKRSQTDGAVTYQKKVVRRMIVLFCRLRHGSDNEDLCPSCGELVRYTAERLDKCPFADEKPNCSCCRVHCYSPQMRERVRQVMRFSGPRMPWYRPGDFLVYLWRKIRYK